MSALFAIAAASVAAFVVDLALSLVRGAPFVCDNLCRMRQDHYDTGTCYEYIIPDCVSCVGACRCGDRNDYNETIPNCANALFAPFQNTVTYYDSCNPICPTGAVQEATNMTGQGITSNPFNRDVCRQ